MNHMPVALIDNLKLDCKLIKQYEDYLIIRIKFLLERFRKFPDFPGVQTGYNSITGQEFSEDHLFSYSWINGRGTGVFSKFANYFPEYHDELLIFALHTVKEMEKQQQINRGFFPFRANNDGTETSDICSRPKGYKSYSDIYAGYGFLEYGIRSEDNNRIKMAKQIFSEVIMALDKNYITLEPDPIDNGKISENPWSVALDISNEFAKHLNEKSYLDIGARIIKHILGSYYIEDKGTLVEYITPDKHPFVEENGGNIIDPGHSIEFAGFALEFSRLAEKTNIYPELCSRINDICPKLILWNMERGWNSKFPGLYKTIDSKTGTPLNNTMPWWGLPEAMLALLLAYERVKDKEFLNRFKDVHNAYFGNYLNPKTNWGPYQNMDGSNGRPIDIPPACKFQDPEFHSGKNILTVIEVIGRIDF